MSDQISSSELAHCLYCGYDLHGLSPGHACPECGHVPDWNAERQKVLALVNQPFLKLGRRMLQFWRPLPPGFWWVLVTWSDWKSAHMRFWVGRLLWIGAWFFVAILLADSQPAGCWEMSGILVYPEDFTDFALKFMLFVTLAGWLSWWFMRWVTLSIIAGWRGKVGRNPLVFRTAALYLGVPFHLLLIVEAVFVVTWWVFSAETGSPDADPALLFVSVSHAVLSGLGWISAIRSDQTGRFVKNKVLAVFLCVLLGGPGGLTLFAELWWFVAVYLL